MNVILKRSTRAKRTSLKVRQGRIILTVARGGSVSKAYDFLNSHLEFLNNRLKDFKQISFEDGSIVKLLGKEYKIVYSNKIELQTIAINDDELVISRVVKDPQELIMKSLSHRLKQEITNMAANICDQLEVTYKKIAVKNMHSKWGSCSSSGNLSFCLKLIFFDIEILRYVVVHEICHLREMNHSKNFWELVESVYPNWRAARTYLKNEGAKIL